MTKVSTWDDREFLKSCVSRIGGTGEVSAFLVINLLVLIPITQCAIFLCPADPSHHHHPQSGDSPLFRQCASFFDQHVRGQTKRIELAGKVDLIIGLNTVTGIG
jgi:hypothetical protein